jgi:hypothetical protein
MYQFTKLKNQLNLNEDEEYRLVNVFNGQKIQLSKKKKAESSERPNKRRKTEEQSNTTSKPDNLPPYYANNNVQGRQAASPIDIVGFGLCLATKKGGGPYKISIKPLFLVISVDEQLNRITNLLKIESIETAQQLRNLASNNSKVFYQLFNVDEKLLGLYAEKNGNHSHGIIARKLEQEGYTCLSY